MGNQCGLCHHPPSTDEQICLLLTILHRRSFSRMATLQGCTVPRVPLSWLSLIWEAPALLCGCHEARAHITVLLPSTPAIHRLRCPSAIHGVCRIEMLTSTEENCWEDTQRALRQELLRPWLICITCRDCSDTDQHRRSGLEPEMPPLQHVHT